MTDSPLASTVPAPAGAPIPGTAAPTVARRVQAIIGLLKDGPRLTDAVIADCGLSRGEALAVMTILEINGTVRRLPGNLMALNER